MRILNGWLEGVSVSPSPNKNERPSGEDPSLLVIHNISLPPGEFGGDEVRAFFCNELDCSAHPYFSQLQDMRVSAHLFIDRQGGITQFVSLHDRAWHAGASDFRGRDNCNDFSIGIELEGCDDQAYTDRQYSQLIKVTEILVEAFPQISQQRIVGHSDIAPQRKTDPGPAFDWARYRRELSRVGVPT